MTFRRARETISGTI